MANKNKNVVIMLNHKSLHCVSYTFSVLRYQFITSWQTTAKVVRSFQGRGFSPPWRRGRALRGCRSVWLGLKWYDVIKMIMISIKIMMRMLRMMIKTTIRMMIVMLRYICNVVAATHHSQWLSGGASQFHFACDISNYIKLYGWKRFERWKIF